MSNEEEKQPDTLQVFAAEDIKMKDVPPGTAASASQNEEKLPQEEVEKRQKIMLEYTRLSGRYCKPHNKKSRWVTEADLDRVVADGKDLVAMCNLPRGKYSGIAALAHSQIEEKDPLRFFILPNGMVIINPVIIDHTKVPVFKSEGCMSYPDNDIKENVPRYNKITVCYQTLENTAGQPKPSLSKVVTEGHTSGFAHVFQHEVSHLNGHNIYDFDFTAESCEGIGSGPIDQETALKLYEVKTAV